MAGGAQKKKKASLKAKKDPEKSPNLFTSVEEFTGKKETKKTSPKSANAPKRNVTKVLPKPSGKEKAGNTTNTKKASPKAKKTDGAKGKKPGPKENNPIVDKAKKSGPKVDKSVADVGKASGAKAKKEPTKKDGVAKGRIKRRRTSDHTGKKKKKKSKKEKEAEEEAEKQLFRDGFKRFDTDNDGLLSFTEFAEAMNSVGNAIISHRNLVLLFNKGAKDSKMGLPEFLALRGTKPKPDKERKRRNRAARRSL